MPCHSLDRGFLTALITSWVCAMSLLYIVYRRDRPARPGRIDYGLPFSIIALLWTIALWAVLPSALFFIIYRLVSHNPEMACSAVSGFPLISLILLLQGTAIAVFYNPIQAAADVLEPLAEHVRGKKVLILGLGSRGLSVKVLSTIAESVVAVDYTNSRHHVLSNLLPANPHIVTPTTHDYQVPCPAASFDVIVISPAFRRGPPIGDAFTGEDARRLRVKRVLLGALPTLKPGGTIVTLDASDQVFLWEADMLECHLLQGVSVDLDTPHVIRTFKYIYQLKSFLVTAVHAPEGVPPTLSMSINSSSTILGRSMNSPLLGHNLSTSEVSTTIIAFQTFTCVILFGTCYLVYPVLDLPTVVTASARLSSVYISSVTSYPLFAVLQHASLMESQYRSRADIVKVVLRTTGFTILASLFFTFIFWLPSFLLQWVFVTTGTLTANTAQYIGYGVSALFGVRAWMAGQSMGTKKAYTARGISDDKLAIAIS